MNGEGRERLRRARERLYDVRSAGDGALAARAIEEVLVDLRAAFLITRRATVAAQPKRTKGQCRKWFEEREAGGRSDPLIAWAWALRDQAQHEHSLPWAHSFYLDHLSTDDLVRPTGFEKADLIINADGPWLVNNLGTAREQRVRPIATGKSAQSRNVHQIGLADSPVEHMGTPIMHGTDLLGLVELVLEWTTQQLEQAQELWGQDGHA